VEGISFEKDGILATIPAVTNGEILKIAAHFKSNENRILSLVGDYYDSEDYKGDSSLGKERAEVIKAKLMDYGTPENKIITSGKKIAGVLVGKRFYNAVTFKGSERVLKKEFVLPNEVEFSPFVPHVIYYNTGSYLFDMNSELRSYLDQAMNYLNQNYGTVLLVNGYTDNEENRKGEKKLSRDRAREIRTYLYKNGIKKNQVRIQGLGRRNPISPNDSEEGKALNRRVEIKIK
jgi:outer membrane protein OmpA-like peptidoglycan-associated protein